MSTGSRKPILIAIAGGSGSGKTYLAHRIQELAGYDSVAVLSLDQYFRPLHPGIDARDINFDHPSHIDLPLFIDHVRKLKSGVSILAPSYDFRTQTATVEAMRIDPCDVVIVDGLFVLAYPIVDLFDLRIFLDVEPDQRLVGRILRDIRERGSTVEWTIDRYQRFVRASYQTFVEPTKQSADVVVDFTYRRAFFQELLAHIIGDYVAGRIELNDLIERIRSDSYGLGAISGKVRSVGIDLMALLEAIPADVPREPGESIEPELWAADNPRN